MAQETVCPGCGVMEDVFGGHMVCCLRNNFYGRHCAVQEAFATMALRGGQPFVQEAPIHAVSPGAQSPASRPEFTMAAYTLLCRPTANSTLLVTPLTSSASMAGLLTRAHVAPVSVDL